METYNNYLYAATIQGIQGFILQSDELRDIVGASELIEEISSESFKDFGENKTKKKEEKDNDKRIVINAAGNIKYLFQSKEACEYAVLNFPRYVMSKAPGITVSQAVVGYNEKDDFADAIEKVEEKLKAQRNKQMETHPVYMSMRRSRQTGLPVEHIVNKEFLDAGSYAKRKSAKKGGVNSTFTLSKKCFGIDDNGRELTHQQIAYDIEEITHKNDWIAVIHADGNGLGQVVQKVGKNRDSYRAFSLGLDKASKTAAKAAFDFVDEKYNLFDNKEKSTIPIRPIVLGGDDFTVICRADFALEYTKVFLKSFEEETQKELGEILENNNVFAENENFLTACAGISFIKSSFPFHYGYTLAGELCKEAKKRAKANLGENEATPSCIMFHKVQDSFVEKYEEIIKRELTSRIKDRFDYGPYFLRDRNKEATISNLIEETKLLEGKDGSAIKSHLREWLADIKIDDKIADQRKERLLSNLENEKQKGFVQRVTQANNGKVAAYDILSLHSIMYNVTKEAKEND